jgi:hypothetical protein
LTKLSSVHYKFSRRLMLMLVEDCVMRHVARALQFQFPKRVYEMWAKSRSGQCPELYSSYESATATDI